MRDIRRYWKEVRALEASLPDFEFLGFIPYHRDFVEADIAGRQPFEAVRSRKVKAAVAAIVNAVLA